MGHHRASGVLTSGGALVCGTWQAVQFQRAPASCGRATPGASRVSTKWLAGAGGGPVVAPARPWHRTHALFRPVMGISPRMAWGTSGGAPSHARGSRWLWPGRWSLYS
ncbi:MAG: hypothetical protein Q8T13_07495 [Acidobacteriota bacterium]|nr:hypothetical protein [Acidobacteriota bacterium]